MRSMDRGLSGGEDTFLWLSRGDLKGQTESENNSSTRSGITNHINITQQKYYKQKQVSNADSINNLMRQ